MNSLLNYTRAELQSAFHRRDLPAYRAEQVLAWIYAQRVTDWPQMTNLPRPLRRQLAEQYVLRQALLHRSLTSTDGAIKFILRWPDGALTETVLMPSPRRHTVCISCQVGCPVRCGFCASGAEGLQRSLTAAEMVEQALWARQLLPPDQRLSNVVVMGMGEPLANYDNTLRAIRILNADWGLNIAARHITLSTIGLAEGIRRLAREPLQITLAVSLHAADDALRAELIPWAHRTSLAELLAVLQQYYQLTHREVTLEYVLLDGVNCSIPAADDLIRWARQLRCNINLINYNPIDPSPFRPASPAVVRTFMDRLQRAGLNVQLRHSRGTDISAACGQLRHSQTVV